MTRIDAPPAFRSVALRDRYTWHRATLQQWVDTRSAIVRRAEKTLRWAPSSPSYERSLRSATAMLWHEEALAGRPTDVAIAGRLEQRLELLMQEQFIFRAKSVKRLTDWEREFLDASGWLNDLADEYHRGIGRHSLVGLLAEWILSVEEEFDAAPEREKARQLMANAVAQKGYIRAYRNRNPYYPAPIDLLGIWRTAVVMVARIHWLRIMRERAEAASALPTAARKTPMTHRPRKPRGADFRTTITDLVEALRTKGFVTAITLDELLQWPGWARVYRPGHSVFATELTAKLFRVKPQTVNRDLTAGALRAEYKRFRVPRPLQDFRTTPGEIRVGVIREREWYRKKPIVVDDVFMQGHTFFPPPPTVK